LLPDGRVLVTGGTTDVEADLLGPETTAEIYDPILNEWTLISTELLARKDHSAVLMPGGKVILIGGGDPAGAGVLPIESYDIENNEWSVISSLPEGRNLLTATTLRDGSIMVVGGGTIQGFIADFPDHTLRYRVINQ
jgi:N-acetylneuraminic acid mutarotase